MNDVSSANSAKERRLGAIRPIVDECETELEQMEIQVAELNENLDKAMTGALSDPEELSSNQYPRLEMRRRRSKLLDLSTARLVWKIDGDIEEYCWTGMVDEEGVVHQCTDDGNYSRENFEEAFPDAEPRVLQQLYVVERQARKLRSRIHAIADFERAVGVLWSLH